MKKIIYINNIFLYQSTVSILLKVFIEVRISTGFTEKLNIFGILFYVFSVYSVLLML